MSRRSKKRVDYSQFGFMDENDDDFAEFTPPASKKMKTSSKPEGKTKDQNNKNKIKEGRGERKSLNRAKPADQIFENELQMALALSQSESQEVGEELPLVDSNKENTLQTEDENKNSEEKGDVSSDSIIEHKQEVPDLRKTASVGNKADDEIEVIATDITDDMKPKRTSTSKKAKKQEESDFEDDLDNFSSNDDDDDDDDDDDNYDGEDSDFDDCKKKSKSKGKKAVKSPKTTKKRTDSSKAAKPASTKVASKSSAAKSSVRSAGSRTPVVSKPSVPRPSPVARPALSSPSPRWNPPGPAGPKNGETSSLQSPTSGLRLGLSRNMKLKPLHPNLKVQH